ncbi:hypothetical protein VNO80_15376 [Phaseolus coccineus]|uniref:Uncharacterized protein n=1 Tax=Phaseolus coccineus TaxID=3886 RepID=A0AAN9MK65_PHACN
MDPTHWWFLEKLVEENVLKVRSWYVVAWNIQVYFMYTPDNTSASIGKLSSAGPGKLPSAANSVSFSAANSVYFSTTFPFSVTTSASSVFSPANTFSASSVN